MNSIKKIMLEEVLETYMCLIAAMEKFPGATFEDIFGKNSLLIIKEEFDFLKSLQNEVLNEN
jgi:hypothetical protein